MNKRIASYALFIALAVGCGDDDSGSSPGGGEGSACGSSSGCAAGLYCAFQGTEVGGTCTALPAACNGSPDCNGPCYDALRSSCPSGSSSVCSVVSNAMTYGCIEFQDPRKAGETCSEVVGCAADLACFIGPSGAVSTCQAFPASCNIASCECPAFEQQCNDYAVECSSTQRTYTIVCQ